MNDATVRLAIIAAILVSFGATFPSPCRARNHSELQRRVDEACELLAHKGYIRYHGDTTTTAATLGPGCPAIMRILDRALDAFDFSAAHAIALLNKHGVQVEWVGATDDHTVSLPEDADGPTAPASYGVDPRIGRLVDQVYGEKGEGYLCHSRLAARPSLDLDLVETYRIDEVCEEGRGWYTVTVEVGAPNLRAGTYVKVRLNPDTGQIVRVADRTE